MKYKDLTPEQKEARKSRARKRIAEHREEHNARRRKYNSEHREMLKVRRKKYNDENRERLNTRMKKYKDNHREEHNNQKREYRAKDTNGAGVTKNQIRCHSNYILFKTHTKLPRYEIHHCFGYDDPNKFIYIPRKLHLQIHQLLRDKNIPADSDHWNIIRDLVNSCEAYTYIRV